jgi:pyruvate,water dikinase
MKQGAKVIAWFDQVTKDDISSAGGKGANLGEMVHAQIPVPPGFIVTADAYFKFLEVSKLTDEIRQYLGDLDVNDSRKLQEVSKLIKNRISSLPMPADMSSKIRSAYRKLGGGLVAVRSSATAEDLPEASFAGQQRTFLNIQGEDEVVAAVQGCWASLFEPRAIFYRQQHGFDHFKVGIAVPIQVMVQSEASGVLFTVEPLTSDRTKILIEAIFGLGEAIVSGDVTPDQYLLSKEEFKILEKKISKQEWQLVRNSRLSPTQLEGTVKVSVPAAKQALQKLNDDEIVALSRLGKMIEDLYQSPQDIEWAKQGKQLFIVQTRPVTTLKEKVETKTLPKIEAAAILNGVAASPGIAVGTVKIVPEASQIDKVQNGDILVAEMTTPDFVPAMKRAVGIVTDRGGRTAHAAIVSRELGVPCVVGTEIATKTLTDGQEITVDGFNGQVYAGRVAEPTKAAPKVITQERIKTKTRVYVNLAEPELADVVAARHVDGVGLLRAEFMMAQKPLGQHPRYMLHEGKGEQFMETLARGITTFTKAFHPRPVVYRTTDFKTNEYRNLTGGDRYEEFEENPMLGYRGCSRYTRETEVFRLEIDAIKKVCEYYDNLYVMIPFVRFVDELAKIKRFLVAEGLYQFSNFKLWMMVEVPSNVFLIDKFLDVGIDGISIGTNDLTQLILGIDRDNPKLAPQFDERNEAVLMAIERVIKVSASKGITSSICGQAPSVYPELTENLVKWGITSVSVSPDMIDETRRIIAAAEAKLGQA